MKVLLKKYLCVISVFALLLTIVPVVANAEETEYTTETTDVSITTENTSVTEDTTTVPATEENTEPATEDTSATEPTEPTEPTAPTEPKDPEGDVEEDFEQEGCTVFRVELSDEDDMTTAYNKIQDMLNLARDNATPDNIYKIVLPRKKIIKLDSVLNVYSNTYLEFNRSTILKEGGSTSSILKFGNKLIESTGYDGYGNITLHNGTIDGWDNECEMVSSNTMRFGHAQHILIEKMNFVDNIESHFIEIAASRDVVIKDCKFLNQQKTETGNASHEAIQIDALQEVSFPLYESYDGTTCSDITITGCTFENVLRGIGSHAVLLDDNGYFTDFHITNNIFRNVEDYAVLSLCWLNAEISNNKMEHCGYGIMLRMMRSDLNRMYDGELTAPITDCNSTIYNNEINSESDAIKLLGVDVQENVEWKNDDGTAGTIPAGDYLISNVTINSNVINAGGNGILLSHASDSIISSNTITVGNVEGGNKGIYLFYSSHDNTIKDNTIVCTEDTIASGGVQLAGTSCNNYINENSIYGGFKNGVSLNSGSDNCVIENNTIGENRSNAVFTSASKDTTISGNKINSTTGNGVSVKESSTATVISNNELSLAQGTCIIVDSSVVKDVVSNTITGGNNGIYANVSSLTNITANVVKESSYGIYLKEASVELIENNIITNARTFGIRANACVAGAIRSNTIENSVESGMHITKSSGVLESNSLKTNGKYGIYIDRESTNDVYVNEFLNNKLGDIYLDGQKSRVVSNLSVPQKFTIDYSIYNKIRLSWTLTDKLNIYNIYRSTDNKNFELIGSTDTDNYTDTKINVGQNYYYKITVINVASKAVVYGASSDVKSGNNKGTATISSFKVKQVNTALVTLSWKSSAVPQYFEIYRKCGSGAYSKLAQVAGTVYSYSDKTAVPGKTYYYRVRSLSYNFNNKAQNGSFVTAVKLKIAVMPGKFTSATLKKNTKDKIVIKLTKAAGNSGYQIFTSTSKTKGYKLAATVNATSCTVKGVVGKTNYFKIRTYKKIGKKMYYSGYSGVKSVKIKKEVKKTTKTDTKKDTKKS